ncbi:MAG: sterol desaturase family protein [Deltaproteobacteria bacterium]|nr:sterol desaturase family protein [Deltaproteobacteria bacterium]
MPASEFSEFRFGDGKISGTLSLALGVLGFGAVLCLLYPSLLTTPDMRSVYSMPLVRALIQGALALAFALGVLNVVLGWRRYTGVAGIALAVAATLLGGSEVEIETPLDASRYIGLDWFILNLFVLALVFVPMERVFGRLREQKIFRRGWRTDLAHFFASHVGVQVSVLLTMIPAAVFFRWLVDSDFQTAVGAQPLLLQAVEALVLADLFAYASHRLFHSVPLLWRFHAIHHSCQQLDWLASSRLHLVDILLTRAVAFVPLYVMGFAPAALYPYLVFASLQGIFIHANLGFRFGWLRYVLVTPQFHHWHHTAQPEFVDRNFAIHLPLIDWLFGTYYLPDDRWPERYGIDGDPIPDGWWKQLVDPFISHPDR